MARSGMIRRFARPRAGLRNMSPEWLRKPPLTFICIGPAPSCQAPLKSFTRCWPMASAAATKAWAPGEEWRASAAWIGPSVPRSSEGSPDQVSIRLK